jgi:hypothetical protein
MKDATNITLPSSNCLALSYESCWEDGGVESVETLHFSCSEAPPSSNALPISFCFIDFAL